MLRNLKLQDHQKESKRKAKVSDILSDKKVGGIKMINKVRQLHMQKLCRLPIDTIDTFIEVFKDSNKDHVIHDVTNSKGIRISFDVYNKDEVEEEYQRRQACLRVS
jgi:hypothetical protein